MNKLAISRYYLDSTKLTILCAIYFTVVLNTRIWLIYFSEHALTGYSSYFHVLAFALVLFGLFLSLLALFNFPFIQKIVYTTLILLSAPAFYFSLTYNTVFDSSMFQNVMETDVNEVMELCTFSLIGTFLLLGLIPALFIYKMNINYTVLWKRALMNSFMVIGGLVIAFGSLYTCYADFSSFVRNNKNEITNSLLPVAPVNGLAGNFKYLYKSKKIKKQIVSHDAYIKKSTSKKPLALVILVGETARHKSFAEHFPESSDVDYNLDSLDNLLYFDDFSSCGTNTAMSIPCMFSFFPKDQYERRYNKMYENVAELIQRVGYDVSWRENQHGCKGICNHLKTLPVNEEYAVLHHLHHDKEYYDESLVVDLGEIISRTKKNQVIFLHEMGSHGPSYYKRVPEDYRRLGPACTSSDFKSCSDEEIENAYNNTIIYNKHVIDIAINELKKIQQDYNVAFMYLSDHGESTGEGGYYLHGLPYFMAPEEQTHIPALMWMSDGYLNAHNLDVTCLHHVTHKHWTHDNFSHTLLGMLDISSKLYQPEMDMLNTCQNLSQYNIGAI